MEDEEEEEPEGIGLIEDKYIILQKLSYGGQANVFSVKDKNTNNIYAAKIPKINTQDAQIDEIRILNILKNKKTPNMINIVDSGRGIVIRKGREPETTNYLIMDLAKKRCIFEYIHFPKEGFTKGFGEPYSKVIFYKIVKNIQIIHEKGISHRDIKLENFLFDGDDFDVKISDFGLSTEYSPNLIGECGTPEHKAPEIYGIYDGYKIDVFSLGNTLFMLTFGINCFEKDPAYSKIYPYAISKHQELKKIYWEILQKFNEKTKEASDDFKDLFDQIIEPNPEKRITIEKILQHKWFGKIRNMTPEQLKQYEIEIELIDELKRREIVVNEKSKEEIEKKNASSDIKYYKTHVKKSLDSNSNIFKGKPKYIEKDKYMNYCLYIKGILEPNDFMYMIYQKIIDEYPNCLIENKDDDKPKFNVVFKGEGMFANIKEQLKKLKIENEEKEAEEKEKEDKDMEENELIIRIKLYQTSEGYLLRFVKKQGDKYDFIEKFEDIKNLVKELI